MRRGIPLFPLILLVILAGLLLGGLLAQMHRGTQTTVAMASGAPAITPVPSPATPLPTKAPTSTPSPKASPSSKPPASQKASPSPTPAVSASASATPARTPAPSPSPKRAAATPAVVFATAKPAATTAPAAAVTHTAAPATRDQGPPTPQPTQPPISGGERAALIVRSYLQALERGDESTAASYLTQGLPSEPFMADSAKIDSIAVRGGDPTAGYRVTADVLTSRGEYYIEFHVANGPNGYQITDHYAIKP